MKAVRFEPEWPEKATKKRSIRVVCEHFEEFFQTILAKDGRFLNCAEQLRLVLRFASMDPVKNRAYRS